MKKPNIFYFAASALISISFFLFISSVQAQKMDGIEKDRMKSILNIVKDEVKKNYYDPNYHSINLDDRFKLAEAKLSAATSTGQSLAIIAQTLIDFNDSHLFFVPPSTSLAVEYGWRMKAIGDKVFVTQVKPGSDADKKGLKPGDQILTIGGFHPSKKELWKVIYYYNALSKRESLAMQVVSPEGGSSRDLEIKSQIKKRPLSITPSTLFRLFDDFYEEENDKHRFWKIGAITIWKMPSFEIDPNDVDGLVDRAKSGNSLILDLRGNGGGYVKALEALTASFFDKDIKIGEMKGRKKIDPSIAKTRGNNGFKGKLIVLVDSDSGSAAEIFARLIQLEKRGTVLGDVSAGAVMQSKFFETNMGTQNVVSFGVSVTEADVIMSDGKSLEHTGVIPDEVILLTGSDLASGKDPIMARAVEILGGILSAEAAGKMSKYYWKKD